MAKKSQREMRKGEEENIPHHHHIDFCLFSPEKRMNREK